LKLDIVFVTAVKYTNLRPAQERCCHLTSLIAVIIDSLQTVSATMNRHRWCPQLSM